MSILFAVLLFSILIFVHELGHFLTAKAFGVQVNEFSLFMGPALWKKQVGQTLYAIRAVPIGGYCAMEGEDGDSDNPHAFGRAAWWKRLIILAAGAAMNFVIGVAMMGLAYLPVKQVVVPVVTSFESYSTMDDGDGMQAGDRILALDGEKIYVYSDFSLLLNLNGGTIHDVLVERGGEKVLLEDLPMERTQVTNPDGTVSNMLGVNFTAAPLKGFDKLSMVWNHCLDTVRLVRLSLQMLVRGQVGLSDMTGPVGIVKQMSDISQASGSWVEAAVNLMYSGAFIAINLAVMNLLPIPALDGGRIVGVAITTAVEAVTRKKLNPMYEGYLHGAGMILLLGLMAVIMFKDIWYLFR